MVLQARLFTTFIYLRWYFMVVQQHSDVQLRCSCLLLSVVLLITLLRVTAIVWVPQ